MTVRNRFLAAFVFVGLTAYVPEEFNHLDRTYGSHVPFAFPRGTLYLNRDLSPAIEVDAEFCVPYRCIERDGKYVTIHNVIFITRRVGDVTICCAPVTESNGPCGVMAR